MVLSIGKREERVFKRIGEISDETARAGQAEHPMETPDTQVQEAAVTRS